MLDMGFEPQVRAIVEEFNMGSLYEQTDESMMRQTMMFSATFADEIQVMARDFLWEDYIFLSVGRVGATNESIEQKLVWVESFGEKFSRVKKAIKEESGDGGLTLVFVETKRGADELEKDIWNSGINVTTIHGDRSQNEREE